MANRPADAGSGRVGTGSVGTGSVGTGSVGTGRGLAPVSNAAPQLDPVVPPSLDAAPPPPVHHDAPRPPAGHRAPRSQAARSQPARSRAPRSRQSHPARDRGDPMASGLAWVPYLIVLAGAGAGMFVAWQGSRYAGWGAGLVGCSLLAAGLARLILPPRYAGLLSTRRKGSDVLAFAVFGGAVLAVALMLP